jgi:K+-sensing histidine kinase KdpD
VRDERPGRSTSAKEQLEVSRLATDVVGAPTPRVAGVSARGGTGLGLSISWDIVTQQHGGTIEVDSRVGEFTEFTIRLPRAHRAIIAAEAAE